MTVVLTEKQIKKITEKTRELAQLLQSYGVINVLPPIGKAQPPKIINSEHTEDAKKILEHYQKVHPTRGKGVRPGHKYFKLIVDRLNDGFDVQDLCLAIDGNKTDEWHAARAAGHGLDFIFRNSGKVEQFIEETKQKPKRKIGYDPGSKEFGDGAKGFNLDE